MLDYDTLLRSITVEKSLQMLIEQNLDSFLGVTYLASEYDTGEKFGGRIDTLGIDDNYCPVIIGYQRATNENIINQGLFYLDWLLNHKAEFQNLVTNKNGAKSAKSIDWAKSRVICIARDFTRCDTYATEQLNLNIELIRYKKFEDSLIF